MKKDDIFSMMNVPIEEKKVYSSILLNLIYNVLKFEEAEFIIQNYKINSLIKQIRILPDKYKLYKLYSKTDKRATKGKQILNRGIIKRFDEITEDDRNTKIIIELSEEIQKIQKKKNIKPIDKHKLIIFFYNYIFDILKNKK
ncbi:MAG TPA: hypothetical protein PLD27_10310 [bacterium]|nr:hypothetical protein [bacterium]HOL47627.1 hypothetical protein [bacterium]HPQ19617.1 hypothetical protein [bacterium]